MKIGFDVNETLSADWDEGTLLHVACKSGSISLINLLIDKDSNLNARTKQEMTPLMTAVQFRHLNAVKILLAECQARWVPRFTISINGAESIEKLENSFFQEVDASDHTILFLACQVGGLSIIHFLFQEALKLQTKLSQSHSTSFKEILNVNSVSKSDGSALSAAVTNGFVKVAQFLLSNEAAVNAVTSDGRTCLYLAAERGFARIVKIILEARSSVSGNDMVDLLFNDRSSRTMEEAFMLSLTSNSIPNVPDAAAGCLIDLGNDSGKTPIFIAAEKGHSAVVELLVSYGADYNKPTYLNKTPIYAAAENGHIEVISSLLRKLKRKELLHETNFGTTALFMAKRNGFQKIYRMLTEFCAKSIAAERSQRKRDKKKQRASSSRLTRPKLKRVKDRNKPKDIKQEIYKFSTLRAHTARKLPVIDPLQKLPTNLGARTNLQSITKRRKNNRKGQENSVRKINRRKKL
eukprot:augustus_masked-scaffold_20-processed-gene-0.12-mRNA-1 protein AED:0.44 eAED:0.44 QI:0/-1/0/1/-1/1/1/0/463